MSGWRCTTVAYAARIAPRVGGESAGRGALRVRLRLRASISSRSRLPRSGKPRSARRARHRRRRPRRAVSRVSSLGSRTRAALAWRCAHRVVDRGRGEARARPCISGLPRGRVPVAGLQGALPSAGVARGAAGAGRYSGVETFRGHWRAGPLTGENPPLRSERGDGQGDPADQECRLRRVE